MSGNHLDLVSGHEGHDRDKKNASAAEPFLGIHFKCCGIYTRIYRNRQQSAYEGRCPRCARAVRVPIGQGGTGSRFFEAGS